MNRRAMIRAATGGVLTLGMTGAAAGIPVPRRSPLKGNIRHSVCRWVCSHLSVEALCALAKEIGFSAIAEPEYEIRKLPDGERSSCSKN